MFSYLVASICYEYGVVHYEETLVLTREKEPSIYTRGKILKALKGKMGMTDSDVQSLEKGKVATCWGEDRYL